MRKTLPSEQFFSINLTFFFQIMVATNLIPIVKNPICEFPYKDTDH